MQTCPVLGGPRDPRGGGVPEASQDKEGQLPGRRIYLFFGFINCS